MYHFYGGKKALQNIRMRGNQIFSSQLDLVTDHKKSKAEVICARILRGTMTTKLFKNK